MPAVVEIASNTERHFAGATYNEQDATEHHHRRDRGGVARRDSLLSELADRIGLTAALSESADGLRQRRAGRDPGRVLVDVAVAIADGPARSAMCRCWLTMRVCTARPAASRRPRRSGGFWTAST